MSNNLDSDPTPATGEIEMSWEAIWQRLRRVDELNELCRYLGEYQPVPSNGASETGNDHGTPTATD